MTATTIRMNPLTPNPAIQARNEFDRSTVPTMLELNVGSPEAIEGLTNASTGLKGFAISMKAATKAIGDIHFRIMDDTTLTDAGRLVRSAQHAKTKIEQAKADLTGKLKIAEKALAELRPQIDAVLAPPSLTGDALLDERARTHLLAMEPQGRPAAARNDPRLMAAAARSPAWAVGIVPDIHKKLQHEYLKTVIPEATAQYDDIHRGIETATQAFAFVEKTANKLIDFQTAESIAGKSTAGSF